MSKNIRIRISEKVKSFKDNEGRKPTKLYLTNVEEADFEELTSADIGELAQRIFREGVRRVIQANGNTYMGYEVQWDAEEFKVE
jgi:hypothetical protein